MPRRVPPYPSQMPRLHSHRPTLRPHLPIASTPALLILLIAALAGCAMPLGPASDSTATVPSATGGFGLGRLATPQEIEAWNIDIMPDGTGLPKGLGSVATGASIYAAQCARCHGESGTEGPFDRLAGRIEGDAFPFAEDPTVKKTVGNYWPYATTLFDYTRRAMPLDRPGSLSDDEVYAVTAYVLFLNELIPDNASLDRETLPDVEMPSRDRFVDDDRRGGEEIR